MRPVGVHIWPCKHILAHTSWPASRHSSPWSSMVVHSAPWSVKAPAGSSSALVLPHGGKCLPSGRCARFRRFELMLADLDSYLHRSASVDPCSPGTPAPAATFAIGRKKGGRRAGRRQQCQPAPAPLQPLRLRPSLLLPHRASVTEGPRPHANPPHPRGI